MDKIEQCVSDVVAKFYGSQRFFSVFAWPHISPTIDKIFAAMLKPPGAR